MSRRTEDEDIAPDFISTPESQLAALEDFISVTAEDARANRAMGLPFSDELARIARAREPRTPRRLLLDAWLSAQLTRRAYTNDELFALLPESEDGKQIYREDEKVWIDGQKSPLGRSGFDKRATAARKQLAKPR